MFVFAILLKEVDRVGITVMKKTVHVCIVHVSSYDVTKTYFQLFIFFLF